LRELQRLSIALSGLRQKLEEVDGTTFECNHVMANAASLLGQILGSSPNLAAIFADTMKVDLERLSEDDTLIEKLESWTSPVRGTAS